MRSRFVLVLLLAGCSGGAKQTAASYPSLPADEPALAPKPVDPDPNANCDRFVPHQIAIVRRELATAPDAPPPEVAERMFQQEAPIVLEKCKAMPWDAAYVACGLGASDIEGLTQCARLHWPAEYNMTRFRACSRLNEDPTDCQRRKQCAWEAQASAEVDACWAATRSPGKPTPSAAL